MIVETVFMLVVGELETVGRFQKVLALFGAMGAVLKNRLSFIVKNDVHSVIIYFIPICLTT